MRLTGMIVNRNLSVLMLGLLLLFTVSCGSDGETELGVETPTEIPSVQAATATLMPVPISTLRPTDTPIDEPTPTSPVPSPTPPLTPTPSPTPLPPPPEPTFYTIQPGDTLLGIAEQFGVTLEMLATANGYNTVDEFFLIAGTDIQIPLCQSHEVVAGNTLAALAQICSLTLDDLVTRNIAELAPLGSLDAVSIGFILYIPEESTTPEDVDCNLQPEREQVIEYLPKAGEGVFCLAQKFNVSTTAIIQSNIERLEGENIYGTVPLLIVPVEGTIYIVTDTDVENGATVIDIATWYEVEVEAVNDWNGNSVADPLQEGQQLLIIDANLIFGRFQSVAAVAEEGGSSG